MVLRPAEIAVIILTFSEYSIRPFHSMIGLDIMDDQNKQLIIKIVSFLALGEISK
jgi:solute carrier family 7 (L-type amino acid transporter), member 9/15